MGRGTGDPHLRSDLREKGEQLSVIAFDLGLVKTTYSGETEQKYAATLVAVDAALFFVKAILFLVKGGC